MLIWPGESISGTPGMIGEGRTPEQKRTIHLDGHDAIIPSFRGLILHPESRRLPARLNVAGGFGASKGCSRCKRKITTELYRGKARSFDCASREVSQAWK